MQVNIHTHQIKIEVFLSDFLLEGKFCYVIREKIERKVDVIVWT